MSYIVRQFIIATLIAGQQKRLDQILKGRFQLGSYLHLMKLPLNSTKNKFSGDLRLLISNAISRSVALSYFGLIHL